jgi:serine protease Do
MLPKQSGIVGGRTALAGALLFAILAWPAAAQPAPASRSEESMTLGRMSESFRQLAEKVSPSVVTVTSTGYRPVDDSNDNDTSDVSVRQLSTGSGVIIDPAGYVVTNAHVVAGAERVTVILTLSAEAGRPKRTGVKPRGRSLRAEIVGVDLETDIALLKVPETGLPALPFGNSDQVEQGQFVLAFGSPLGLDNSVSMGVVSAPARQLRAEDAMLYIQTDAPINPGNSGGPLVNTQGEVVGINTLILSQGGGNEGIGFAAPSNTVSAIVERLRKNGRVIRGQIGVNAQSITPVLAAGLGLARNWGVILSDIDSDGPADRAGLQSGDIVLSVNGKSIENTRQLEMNLYLPSVRDTAKLEVLRGKTKMTVDVQVEKKPRDPSSLATLFTTSNALVPKLGVFVIDLDQELRDTLTPLRKESGVLVVAQSVDGPLAGDGFKTGDVIYSINREPVASVKALRAIVDKLRSGDPVAGVVERQGTIIYVAFEVP